MNSELSSCTHAELEAAAAAATVAPTRTCPQIRFMAKSPQDVGAPFGSAYTPLQGQRVALWDRQRQVTWCSVATKVRGPLTPDAAYLHAAPRASASFGREMGST